MTHREQELVNIVVEGLKVKDASVSEAICILLGIAASTAACADRPLAELQALMADLYEQCIADLNAEKVRRRDDNLVVTSLHAGHDLGDVLTRDKTNG